MIQAVKVLIIELGFSEENSEEDLQPSEKKLAFQDFAEWEDSGTTESYVSLESEITAYLNVKLDASESHGPKYVLQWWEKTMSRVSETKPINTLCSLHPSFQCSLGESFQYLWSHLGAKTH